MFLVASDGCFGLYFQPGRGQGQFFVAGTVGSQAFERLSQVESGFGQAEPTVNGKISFGGDACHHFSHDPGQAPAEFVQFFRIQRETGSHRVTAEIKQEVFLGGDGGGDIQPFDRTG